MATGFPTRENAVPYMVHAMQLDVSWNTPGIGAGVPFANFLPQDAQILCSIVKILTAFNASAPVLVVGTNATNYNNIVAAADVNEALTGADVVFTGAELDLSAAPAQPFVKYTDSGGASAGRALITLLYIPKIDR